MRIREATKCSEEPHYVTQVTSGGPPAPNGTRALQSSLGVMSSWEREQSEPSVAPQLGLTKGHLVSVHDQGKKNYLQHQEEEAKYLFKRQRD